MPLIWTCSVENVDAHSLLIKYIVKVSAEAKCMTLWMLSWLLVKAAVLHFTPYHWMFSCVSRLQLGCSLAAVQAGVVPCDHSCIASAVCLFDRVHRRRRGGGVSTARLENRCSWRSQATNPRWERDSVSLPTAWSRSVRTQTVNCRFSEFMNATRTRQAEKNTKSCMIFLYTITLLTCDLCWKKIRKKDAPEKQNRYVCRYKWRHDVQCIRRVLKWWCFSSGGASSHDCVLWE